MYQSKTQKQLKREFGKQSKICENCGKVIPRYIEVIRVGFFVGKQIYSEYEYVCKCGEKIIRVG